MVGSPEVLYGRFLVESTWSVRVDTPANLFNYETGCAVLPTRFTFSSADLLLILHH